MTIYLQDYKTFNSKTELNEAVAAHLSNNKLNKTERDVLWMLSQYSVKYYGASHLKAQTIADKVEKSIRTVRRVLKRLEQLNIILPIRTTRKVMGGKGANIFKILPYDDLKNNNDTLNLSHCEQPEKVVTTSVSKSKKNNEPFSSLNKLSNTDDTQESINTKDKIKNNKLKKSLLKTIPSSIAKTLDVFFDDYQDIYKIYGTMLKAKSNAPFEVQFEEDEGLFNDALMNVIRRFKTGKVANLHGYLYKTIIQATKRSFLLNWAY